MSRRGRQLFWATVLGFSSGTAALGILLHRRSQVEHEPASERAERLLQRCQEKIRQIERQVEQTEDTRRAGDPSASPASDR